MDPQQVIQRLLRDRLTQMQSRHPHYSLRAFAQKIGLNPGALSGVLNGKRNVSYKIVERIAERLALDPLERSQVLKDFNPSRYQSSGSEESKTFRQISQAQFKVVAEWQHFAILSLIKTKDFKSDPEWIAFRLGISEQKVKDSIERLIQVGLVVYDLDHQLKRTAAKFKTSDDIHDLSLRASHVENLELSRQSLEQDALHLRDHTWVTFTVNPEKIKIAKEKIRIFQQEFSEWMCADENQKEVYRLALHFFPLTQVSSKGEGINEKI